MMNTLLLIDDSAVMRKMTAREIARSGVFKKEELEILEAANGPQGLELFLTRKPRLVIVDWNMPVMSGLEVVRKIRETGIETRVLMLMAEATGENVVRAKAGGLADWAIAKPLDPEGFKEILKTMAGR